MAIDPGIAGLAARKYQIQQEQADTAQRLAQSQAGFTDVQAGLAPGEAAARNFATRGQGQAAYGQANLANTTAQLAPRQLSSEDTLRRGQAALYGAEAGRMGVEASLLPQQFGLDYLRSQQQNDQADYARRYDPLGGELNSFLQQNGWSKNVAPSTSIAPTTRAPAAPSVPGPQASAYPVGFGQGNLIGGNPLGQNAYHASQGATKVPGKGDGKTDTQPAMLAPGEAVLNRGAAEHLGRDTISLLNAIGARRMGLTIGSDSDTSTPNPGSKSDSGQQVSNQTGGTPGYAMGEDYVDPGLSTATQNGAGYAWGTSNIAAGDSWPMRGSPGPDGRAPMPGYAGGTDYVQMAADFGKRAPISPNPAPAPAPPPKPNMVDPNTQGRDSPWGQGQNQTLRQRMFPQTAAGDQPQYLAKGTSKVPDKNAGKGDSKAQGKAPTKGEAKGKMSPHAAAHTPTGANLPPGILEALLSMGQQGGAAPPMGGGMPGLGSPPPMPPSMPMPQVARR